MKQKSNEGSSSKKSAFSWVKKIVLLTFILSATMSLVAESFLRTVSLPIAFIILFLFIFIGIVFDTIGISIAAAEVTPFVSMSSKKIKGASQALYLLKRADIVSNICNDVVGDISGIISGAMGAIITKTLILRLGGLPVLLVAVILSAIIATLTVSGKSVGKILAMRYSKDITLSVGKLISVFKVANKRVK